MNFKSIYPKRIGVEPDHCQKYFAGKSRPELTDGVGPFRIDQNQEERLLFYNRLKIFDRGDVISGMRRHPDPLLLVPEFFRNLRVGNNIPVNQGIGQCLRPQAVGEDFNSVRRVIDKCIGRYNLWLTGGKAT